MSRSSALPRDFTDLLSASSVDELIAERGVRAPFIRMALDGELLNRDCYLGPAGFGAEMPDQVDSAKVLRRLAEGVTLVLQGLHRLWPPLIDFVGHMVDDLGHPVQANAYVTPPNGRGFDAHYDVHDVFVLQIDGHKRWIVHEPAHYDPLSDQPWTEHRRAIAAQVAGKPVIDVVLAPGDALYLPRGWIHSARAVDSTSIHLTIGVAPMTTVDVLRAAVETFAADSEFRKSLPMQIDPLDHDAMAAATDKVLAQATHAMRHHASEISAAAAQRISQRHRARTRPAAVRPLATMTAADRAETTTVRWRQGMCTRLEYRSGRVVLRLDDRTISFPESCGQALEALAQGLVTGPDSLPGLAHADGTVLIRRLLREAVVAPTDFRD